MNDSVFCRGNDKITYPVPGVTQVLICHQYFWSQNNWAVKMLCPLGEEALKTLYDTQKIAVAFYFQIVDTFPRV